MKEEDQTNIAQLEEQPDPKLQNQFVWKKNTFVSNNSCPNENPQKVNLCSKPEEGKPSFFASFICQNTKDVVRRNHPQHSSTTQKKVFKFTSTIYWKRCMDILIIEKGLHGD